MPIATRRLSPLAALALVALAVGACGAAGPAPSSPAVASPSAEATPPAATASSAATPRPTPGPPTPVPGGTSPSPDDSYGGGPTTQTPWGTILDRVPEGFPVFPGAQLAEELDEPASGAWVVTEESGADAGTVADWYAEAFRELGWSRVDLGSPLEDGTRVLDVGTDLPECRVQSTFRPAGGSTMIIVMYGAGCAGGDG